MNHPSRPTWKTLALSTATLCLAVLAAPSVTAAQKYFPGCPQWQHKVTFTNECDAQITITETAGCFPGTNPDPPFDGGRCWPTEGPGSFTLDADGGQKVIEIISCWSGNFGVDCDGCDHPITTLAEFTFDGGLDSSYDKLPGVMDTYDVSMVDGFVKPVEIKPDPSVSQGGGTCTLAGCSNTPQCPDQLQNGAGSCLSPCQHAIATGMSTADQEKYCCKCSMTQPIGCTDDPTHPNRVPTGCQGKYGCSPFSPPGNANPGSACCPWFDDSHAPCNASSADRAWAEWAQDYIADIHAACPNQYAWQYDDNAGTRTCQGKGVPMAYQVTFCP